MIETANIPVSQIKRVNLGLIALRITVTNATV